MARVEIPIIVGWQSLCGITPHVPDIVRRFVECDFLLLAAGRSFFSAVIEQIGFASSLAAYRDYTANMPTRSASPPSYCL